MRYRLIKNKKNMFLEVLYKINRSVSEASEHQVIEVGFLIRDLNCSHLSREHLTITG